MTASGSSSDEFPDEFSNLSDEDFVRIDAVVASKLATRRSPSPVRGTPSGEPAVTVQLEEQEQISFMDSPLKRFRKSGRLSVSDLVSPAW